MQTQDKLNKAQQDTNKSDKFTYYGFVIYERYINLTSLYLA